MNNPAVKPRVERRNGVCAPAPDTKSAIVWRELDRVRDTGAPTVTEYKRELRKLKLSSDNTLYRWAQFNGITLAALLLCSCTVGPTIIHKGDVTMQTLGASVLSKSDYASASITMPDGTVLSSQSYGKDETKVPIVQAQIGLAAQGVKHAANAVKQFAH